MTEDKSIDSWAKQDIFADVDAVTAGTGISYVYVDDFEAPAGATFEDNVKLIIINRKFLMDIKDEVKRVAAEKGLRFHEGLEHTRGEIEKRFKVADERQRSGLNKTFYAGLDNLIGDVHIEAGGEGDYPSLCKYLSFLMSRCQQLMIQGEVLEYKPTEIDKAINEFIKKHGLQVNPALIKTLKATHEAVRFGDVEKELLDDNVMEDLKFIVSHIFTARRGDDIAPVTQATDEIYHYLDKKYGIPKELVIKLQLNLSCLNGPEGDGKGKGRSQGGQGNQKGQKGGKKQNGKDGTYTNILPWKTRAQVKLAEKQALEEAQKQLDHEKKKGAIGGLLGAPDHATLTPPTMHDIKFYINTITKHEETIRRIRALLKRLAGKRGFVPAKEGEFTLDPVLMQQAYTDSFKTGGDEERDYYLILKYAIPDIDLVIAQDASGSTSGEAELFSETTVCILESTKQTKIRTAAVSFGDGIRVLKDFHEPVEAGRFYPSGSGGTPMGECLEQALKFNWRRGNTIRRVLVLATDGYPDAWTKVDKPLEQMKRLGIVPVALCVGVKANEDYLKRFDQVYEVDDASKITEAFITTFIEKSLLKSPLTR